MKDIKYYAYARKSSEDSKRQVASIDDQTTAINKMAVDQGLNLIRIFKEERSSKDPGRPVFNEMLDSIERGEADGILCWDIDRLYRNPVDEGRLRWMLQKSVIRVIRTPYRQFYPEDAGLLMGVEGGRATDYVIRLSKNVKRGLQGKVAKGWRPSPAPLGYINIGEVGDKTIAPDQVKFDLVRKLWDLFLSGTVSPRKLLLIANDQLGLRTTIRRKLGGKPITLSHLYKILHDPFYYGYFEWPDADTGEVKLVHGKHRPMITEKEYDRAQVLLGKNGRPRPKHREFPFTGLIHCGECGSSITAEEKNQVICSCCKHKFAYENKTACPKCHTEISEMENPTILNYTYYHCTKKKDHNCSQGAIRVEKLEAQFNAILETITLDDEYLKVALDYLQDKQANTATEESLISANIDAAIKNEETRLSNLNREYTSPQNIDHGIYTPEEFKTQKSQITKALADLKSQRDKVKDKYQESLELSERTFNFCTYAKYHFNTDDLKRKRAIFSTIGSNLTLKDKKLNINLIHPYLLIQNELTSQKKAFEALEPKNNEYAPELFSCFAYSVPSWLRV